MTRIERLQKRLEKLYIDAFLVTCWRGTVTC